MATEPGKVEPLKKVVLSIEAGTAADRMDLSAEPQPYDFIYGIGVGGLSPFERELARGRPGEDLFIPMTREDMPEWFQHLPPPSLALPDTVGSFMLKVRIVTVSQADPREVVKAMAETAACGSDCCGC